MTSIWQSDSEDETRALGEALSGRLKPAGVLLLKGDLGSGKTVLAQGVAAGLGIDSRQVQSPSFTLAREHRGSRGRLIHIDLYRLEPEEVAAVGLWEMLAEPAVKVVEWSERLPFTLSGALKVEMRVLSPTRREIVLTGDDEEKELASNRAPHRS